MTYIKKKEKWEDAFNIGTYLMALRSAYPGVTDYKQQVELLESEFGIITTENQLYLLEEPTIEEDEMDYCLRYKNAGL